MLIVSILILIFKLTINLSEGTLAFLVHQGFTRSENTGERKEEALCL